MSELNRIRQLAGLLTESQIYEENISWKKEDEGLYVTGNWQGSNGPVEMLADGLEYGDGYWKIYIETSEMGLNRDPTLLVPEDMQKIKKALSEWFTYAKNVDFGDDVLSVNDVQLTMPNIKGSSMRQFGSEIAKMLNLKMLGIDGNRQEVVMDFRNTPIPHAGEFKAQELGKEENPYKTDTM